MMHTRNEEQGLPALLEEVRGPEDPYIADLERSLEEVLAALQHEIPPRDNAHNYSPRGKTISLGWDYIDRARKLLDGDGT